MAQARGDLAGAEQAYTQYRAIFERLAAQDPANTGWQRGLAIAHDRVGGVAQARGDLAGAEQAYTQDLVISQRLAAQDPANTGWQQNLASAHLLVGDVAQARGDLAGAEQAYTEYRAIFERLAAQDPANTGWQRGLAIAHNRLGVWRRRAATWPGRSRHTPSTEPSSNGWPHRIPPTPAGSRSLRSRTRSSVTWRAALVKSLWMKILRRLCL